MLKEMVQQKSNEIAVIPQPTDYAMSALDVTPAETTLLFADTVKSFESMSEGDSREFLERCRQTGGE